MITRNSNIGHAPGAVIYTGKKDRDLFIELIDFSKSKLIETTGKTVEECFQHRDTATTTWINVNGLSNVEEIIKLGNHFGLHPLIVEDIANTQQRPKIDEYDNYIFVVFKMLYYDPTGKLVIEHISLVLGENYVLTFQESDGDVFDNTRMRLKKAKGIIRSCGSDYLLYTLLDAIVDNYFLIIERMGEKIELLEDEIFETKDEAVIQKIQNLKKEALKIRRSIFPLREVVSKLEKSESTLIRHKTINYYKDLYDHTIQVIEHSFWI